MLRARSDGIVALGDPLEQVVDGHGLDRQRAAAAFELRQIEQVADDRLELVGFAIDDVEVAAARGLVHREVRHGERLRVAADGGERRHQLVRHVGEQLTPRRVRGIQRGGACFELARHVVEGVRERADLVAAAVVGAHIGAPFADGAGGFFERAQALARRAENQRARPSSSRR